MSRVPDHFIEFWWFIAFTTFSNHSRSIFCKTWKHKSKMGRQNPLLCNSCTHQYAMDEMIRRKAEPLAFSDDPPSRNQQRKSRKKVPLSILAGLVFSIMALSILLLSLWVYKLKARLVCNHNFSILHHPTSLLPCPSRHQAHDCSSRSITKSYALVADIISFHRKSFIYLLTLL